MKRSRAIELYNVFGMLAAGRPDPNSSAMMAGRQQQMTPPDLDPEGYLWILAALNSLKPVFEDWDKVRIQQQRQFSQGNAQVVNGVSLIGDMEKLVEFEAVLNHIGDTVISVKMPKGKIKLAWLKTAANGISAIALSAISDFIEESDLRCELDGDASDFAIDLDDLPEPKTPSAIEISKKAH
jgi:hypothetical protein